MAKKFGYFPSATPSLQAQAQTIGGTYLDNHVLTHSQIVKGVYMHLSPRGVKITCDKALTLLKWPAGAL